MKRLIIATTLILATVGASATAMTPYLSQVDRAEVRRILPDAELDSLTNVQVAAISLALSGERRSRAHSLRSILAWD